MVNSPSSIGNVSYFHRFCEIRISGVPIDHDNATHCMGAQWNKQLALLLHFPTWIKNLPAADRWRPLPHIAAAAKVSI
jgi:hypothetical protein